MRNKFLLLAIMLLFAMTGCKQEQEKVPISLKWEMGQNGIEPGYYENTFYITNEGSKSLDNRWIIYFNQLPSEEIIQPEGLFVVEEICATYYKLYPSVHYLFPKIFGFMERAWNTQPAWALSVDEKLHDKALRKYNARIAEKELPRLRNLGVNFHIAQPGIIVKDGKLYANSTIPGAVIRYTMDGTEPTTNSTAWTTAVDCDARQIKAKAFYLGKESVTTLLLNE